jgi:hypothetical protein
MSSPAATPVVVGPARASRATLAVAWVGTLALSELLGAAAGIWGSCGWPAVPETTRGEAAAGWSATTPIVRILPSSSPG